MMVALVVIHFDTSITLDVGCLGSSRTVLGSSVVIDVFCIVVRKFVVVAFLIVANSNYLLDSPSTNLSIKYSLVDLVHGFLFASCGIKMLGFVVRSM